MIEFGKWTIEVPELESTRPPCGVLRGRIKKHEETQRLQSHEMKVKLRKEVLGSVWKVLSVTGRASLWLN